jgi:hypothetical protein
MKQMTCAQIGDNAPGTCDMVFQAETAKEIGAQASAHAAAAHPGLKERMAQMTDEDKKKWAEGLQQRFDAAPEV